MASFYDEVNHSACLETFRYLRLTMSIMKVEIEDFEFDEDEGRYTYPCPCGDKFEIYLV